jgi:hypothetical protein
MKLTAEQTVTTKERRVSDEIYTLFSTNQT